MADGAAPGALRRPATPGGELSGTGRRRGRAETAAEGQPRRREWRQNPSPAARSLGRSHGIRRLLKATDRTAAPRSKVEPETFRASTRTVLFDRTNAPRAVLASRCGMEQH